MLEWWTEEGWKGGRRKDGSKNGWKDAYCKTAIFRFQIIRKKMYFECWKHGRRQDGRIDGWKHVYCKDTISRFKI